MELSNHTPVPAQLRLGELPGGTRRVGILVAKATFTIDATGATRLDDQSPVPLFERDTKTDLGLLPKDDGVRADDTFEVIVLGRAHAARGRSTASMRVSVSVGPERRELLVFGRRQWVRAGDRWTVTQPEPFQEMPLTWEHAFGGRADVEIDRDAWIEIADPRNPDGLGFDPSPNADRLGEDLGCPPGFPRWAGDLRLPHLEDPAAPIRARSDAPEPLCWATVPLSSGVHGLRSVEQKPGAAGTEGFGLGPGMFHRAHPSWVIARPEMNAEVVLDGMRPEGALRFALPALRVIADYRVGSRSGRRELVPYLLVLLPEEHRLYLVYRRTFALEPREGEPRAMRLRLAQGWRRTNEAGGSR